MKISPFNADLALLRLLPPLPPPSAVTVAVVGLASEAADDEEMMPGEIRRWKSESEQRRERLDQALAS